MTLGMQPSHFPPFPFTVAAYNQSPFPPPATAAATGACPQPPPTSRRSSRKRGHADVDEPITSDSDAVFKRQEVQLNVPHIPPPQPYDDCHPSVPPSPQSPSSAAMQPSSPLPARCVSPAGSDMSMTDETEPVDLITDLQPPLDDAQTVARESVPVAASNEQSSDFYRSVALIRPVLPLPSLSSAAIVELYRQQQQADHDEHDPQQAAGAVPADTATTAAGGGWPWPEVAVHCVEQQHKP